MSSKNPWLRAEATVPSARLGDRDAIEDLVRLTQHDLRRFIASLAGPAEADDLTQETYLRALSALASFRRDASLRTWLLALARRVVVDHFRTSGRRPTVTGAPWEAAAEAEQLRSGLTRSSDPAQASQWQDLLSQVAADRREALVLTQIIGLSYEEAAQVCGCAVGTIRSRVARGRDDLLELLQDGPDTAAFG